MNHSLSVFLINDTVRGVMVSYETGNPADKDTFFKTVEPDLREGDLVIVPTGTRAGFTVARVKQVDVEPDFNWPGVFGWIVGRVDRKRYDHVLAAEGKALDEIKAAEKRHEREKLAAALKANCSGLVLDVPKLADAGDTAADKTSSFGDIGRWR